MRRFAVAALVLLSLCGCLRTYRAEQSSVVSAAVNSDGTTSCCNHSDREVREWHGPWLGQPDRIRP